MPNYYTCSNGERVSQATINKRRSETYRKLYEGSRHPFCEGCDGRAEGTAHIIPQARCKQLHLTDLIWNPINMVPSCHICNGIIENVSSEEFKKLHCYERCLVVLRTYDKERYLKAI